MSRRDELMLKNANIRSTAEISDDEVHEAVQKHRPRSGQGSFSQRQRLEDKIKELESRVGQVASTHLPLNRIAPNPWQPRRVFDEDELQKLAQSINEIGLIQPIVVRCVSNPDTQYQIIAGERRLRAHQILGRETINAIPIEVVDADMAAFALAENIDRVDLAAYEIAVAIRNAESSFPNKKNMAEALGINRTDLYKYLSFFKLPDFVIEDLNNKPNIIGRDAAEAIASLLSKEGDAAIASLRSLWSRVKSGDLDQNKIVGTIEAALRNGGIVRTGREIKKLFIGKEQAGSITRDNATITVKLRLAALTPEKEAELCAVVERMFSAS